MFAPDRFPLIEAYAASLATAGVERGLIGPREVPRLWERHLLNCAVLTDAIPADVTVADVGSGAGLPGIVVAIRRPDLSVTLIEPLLRRATYLEEIAGELGLGNVRVLRARAEDAAGDGPFDVVTARAVAALDKLVGWCLPLVAVGGSLVAMKGDRAGEEIESAAKTLRRWSGRPARVEVVGADLLSPPTTLVRVVRTK